VKVAHLIFLFTLLTMANAFAGKFDIMGGAYSINAKVADNSQTISGLGAYCFSYLQPFAKNFELVAAYNLSFSSVVTGDSAFGFDVGANYFPFNFANKTSIKVQDLSVEQYDLWKPYGGLTFSQRQYSSVKNGYAGFGLQFGTEYYLKRDISFKTELRYISMGGSGNSTATDINVMAGVVFYSFFGSKGL
jgi:hypothetical protein